MAWLGLAVRRASGRKTWVALRKEASTMGYGTLRAPTGRPFAVVLCAIVLRGRGGFYAQHTTSP